MNKDTPKLTPVPDIPAAEEEPKQAPRPRTALDEANAILVFAHEMSTRYRTIRTVDVINTVMGLLSLDLQKRQIAAAQNPFATMPEPTTTEKNDGEDASE